MKRKITDDLQEDELRNKKKKFDIQRDDVFPKIYKSLNKTEKERYSIFKRAIFNKKNIEFLMSQKIKTNQKEPIQLLSKILKEYLGLLITKTRYLIEKGGKSIYKINYDEFCRYFDEVKSEMINKEGDFLLKDFIPKEDSIQKNNKSKITKNYKKLQLKINYFDNNEITKMKYFDDDNRITSFVIIREGHFLDFEKLKNFKKIDSFDIIEKPIKFILGLKYEELDDMKNMDFLKKFIFDVEIFPYFEIGNFIIKIIAINKDITSYHLYYLVKILFAFLVGCSRRLPEEDFLIFLKKYIYLSIDICFRDEFISNLIIKQFQWLKENDYFDEIKNVVFEMKMISESNKFEPDVKEIAKKVLKNF